MALTLAQHKKSHLALLYKVLPCTVRENSTSNHILSLTEMLIEAFWELYCLVKCIPCLFGFFFMIFGVFFSCLAYELVAAPWGLHIPLVFD